MPDTPSPPTFARIRLTDIADEWAEQQNLSSRTLAKEVAAVLRTLPDNQLLDLRIASTVLFDPSTGSGGITHSALADHFESISQGIPPETILTSTGTAPTEAVWITRRWINQVTKEALRRAAFVAGLLWAANGGTA